eukprot:CAMPEP_0194047328 /NCGR_PEP_ID=MMETSP0009_2-20130614/24042_1 /TAXON_ID=210454 /ORGANISM="Grammatophora oceanica, Strain CCMP 410" /LENGTH=151 /DNA_ID=CAMNT_0038692909 /DNA_START=17 /DNA_END=475 /DNA_ORIENTATION=+
MATTAAAAASRTATDQLPRILSTYRSLLRAIERLPKEQARRNGWKEAREAFRKPLDEEAESVEDRILAAGEQIAFLRITTPKPKARGEDAGRWVYKSGEKIKDGSATSNRTGKGVHSNWDGKNLDPCSVKRHNQGLKRAGFVNNAHAKGIF